MKFADAVKRSLKMLSSPEFIKRVKEEDPKMVKDYSIIKKINENGFLTENSQAGHRTSGKEYNTGIPYVNNERAYITGFMLEDKVVKFIEEFNKATDKNAMVIPYVNDDAIELPPKLDIPLTISTNEKGKTTIWSHMSSVFPKSQWDFLRKQVHLSKTEKVIYIFCWDSKWNRNASDKHGLFTEVLEVLKKI